MDVFWFVVENLAMMIVTLIISGFVYSEDVLEEENLRILVFVGAVFWMVGLPLVIVVWLVTNTRSPFNFFLGVGERLAKLKSRDRKTSEVSDAISQT